MDNETFANSNQFAEVQIGVIDVGGTGGNAVSQVIIEKIQGIDSIAANTDLQVLNNSQVTAKIHLEPKPTKGLGVDSNPEVDEKAAQESEKRIERAPEGADMVFIAVGMDDGTGTGAAPAVAKLARNSGALTIGVVTRPFSFEGPRQAHYAAEGLEELKSNVDTLTIVTSNRLLEMISKKTPMMKAFKEADNVLRQGVQGISGLIVTLGYINLDFTDTKTLMPNQDSALMGVGVSAGENRTTEATKKVISSPLLEVSADGVQHTLTDITDGKGLSMPGAQEVSDIVRRAAGTNVDISFGMSLDESMGDEVRVTVITAGTNRKKRIQQQKPAEREVPRVTRSIPQEEQPEQRDLFDGWNDPVADTSNQSGNSDNESSHVTKPEFSVFSDDAANTDDNDDTSLSTPPFFRDRRK